MIDDLYSARLLRLAAETPRLGRLADPDASSEKVSKLCGSRIVVDVTYNNGRVTDFAQDVKACALGQASASVLGAHVIGASLAELEAARDAFRSMLKSGRARAAGPLRRSGAAGSGEGLSRPPHLHPAGLRGGGGGGG